MNSHSSSSAIFERDIEPIIPPSPPSTLHNPPNPHRIPRAKHSGQLDQSVPSVLDSAASVLATMDDAEDQVAVVAPLSLSASSLEMSGDSLGLGLSLGLGFPSTGTGNANGRSSGFASPIGSLRSRSPSPLGMRIASTSSTSGAAGQQLQPLNLSIPVPHQSSQQPSLGLSMEAANNIPTSSSPPKAHSISSRSPSVGSPASRARSISPSQHHSPSLIPMSISHSTSSTHAPATSPTSLSHPPSPAHGPKKRLSFMSYTDLLSSTPSTTQPLSSLTSHASSMEPPPHIPTVTMVGVALSTNASRAASTTGSPLSSPISLPHTLSSHSGATPSIRNVSGTMSINSNHASAVGGPVGGLTHPGLKDSIALLDNMGGEWEREGLGMGLEERLGGFATGTQGRVVVAK
ncbi:hypothetical protein BJ165DRAFT_765957 [Panaeolus papilionaceus]|nr:hypothetical protein BJ165DRAFT_765957 [Panaeolus papilionaceus]